MRTKQADDEWNGPDLGEKIRSSVGKVAAAGKRGPVALQHERARHAQFMAQAVVRPTKEMNRALGLGFISYAAAMAAYGP